MWSTYKCTILEYIHRITIEGMKTYLTNRCKAPCAYCIHLSIILNNLIGVNVNTVYTDFVLFIYFKDYLPDCTFSSIQYIFSIYCCVLPKIRAKHNAK